LPQEKPNTVDSSAVWERLQARLSQSSFEKPKAQLNPKKVAKPNQLQRDFDRLAYYKAKTLTELLDSIFSNTERRAALKLIQKLAQSKDRTTDLMYC
jgi:hypothetical protein